MPIKYSLNYKAVSTKDQTKKDPFILNKPKRFLSVLKS